MKTKQVICFILLAFGLGVASEAQVQNRSPLHPNPYLELPLGNIQAKGSLADQHNRMKAGLTGHLDARYPHVIGSRNGWLDGDGDAWD